MTELFDPLSVGETVSGEAHVIYHLASLPKSYLTLVTVLEVNEGAPKFEVVEKETTFKDMFVPRLQNHQ